MMVRILVLLMVSVLLVGCGGKPPKRIFRQEITINDFDASKVTAKNAETKLAETANAVSHSLEKLAALERARYPKSKIPPPANSYAIGMAQITSVDWTGPVEQIVARVAKLSHYQFKVIGHPPQIPAIVAIRMKDKTLADILRNASYQAQKKARIHVYPRKKIIELRYRNQA